PDAGLMAMRVNGLIVLMILLSACAAGPRFERPAPPAAERYTFGAQPESTLATTGRAGAAQQFGSGAAPPPRWWEAFHCDALNELVGDALAHSPTVLEARSRLRAAQEDLLAQSRGVLYPSVDTQLGVTREKVDPAAFGLTNVPSEPPFTLYNAQVRVSYSLDVFGGNRRAIESMQAQAEYQEYESEAVRLTLAANVVAAAIRQAELESELEYTRQLIDMQRRELDISERRYQLGGVS